MQRSLQEHIASLERKIETLKAQQDDPHRTAGERFQLAKDLETAESALACFRQAYKLEQEISV
jgi:hypothetical protein